MTEYLNQFSTSLLEEFYLKDGETPQQGFERAAYGYLPEDRKEVGDRILEYVKKGWFMFSSPVLSNAPVNGEIPKAMPISCYIQGLPDTVDGQIDALSELAALSVAGGGIGMSNEIRGVSKKSPGVIPYVKTIDGAIGYFKQSSTRKGSCAIYVDVSHPDIIEFVNIRIPGGDHARKVDNRKQVNNAVCFGHDFVHAVDNDLDWDLIDPASNEVRETLKARALWEMILDARSLTGEPYLFNKDNVNEQKLSTLNDKGLTINSSNLCCVTGETLILTDEGEFEIKTKEGEIVNVWNGEEFTPVEVRHTGGSTSTDIYEITLENVKTGMVRVVRCTYNHKFYLQDVDEPCFAENLKIGYELEHFNIPDSDELQEYKIIDVVQGEPDPEKGIIERFCFKEPKRSRGTFNGIVTGQSEITIPVNEERTAVCCLSSVNLEYFDEWKHDELFIQDCVEFLDHVLQYFIDNATDPHLKKAVYSAIMGRDLGLGTMGFHYYLQRNNIPFESGGFKSAAQANHILFSHFHAKCDEATLYLGKKYGEAPDAQGTGRRNVNVSAVAPNSNSSILVNTSPSIDPVASNSVVQSTRVGTYVVRNKYLDKIFLARKAFSGGDDWYNEQWRIVEKANGSVQSLDCLTDEEKAVFKTAYELDQHWVVQHAEDRAIHIDQSQPVNIFFPAGTDKGYFNSVHLKGLRSKTLKTMYYCRMEREAQVESLEHKQREALVDWKSDDCVSCQG